MPIRSIRPGIPYIFPMIVIILTLCAEVPGTVMLQPFVVMHVTTVMGIEVLLGVQQVSALCLSLILVFLQTERQDHQKKKLPIDVALSPSPGERGLNVQWPRVGLGWCIGVHQAKRKEEKVAVIVSDCNLFHTANANIRAIIFFSMPPDAPLEAFVRRAPPSSVLFVWSHENYSLLGCHSFAYGGIMPGNWVRSESIGDAPVVLSHP